MEEFDFTLQILGGIILTAVAAGFATVPDPIGRAFGIMMAVFVGFVTVLLMIEEIMAWAALQ